MPTTQTPAPPSPPPGPAPLRIDEEDRFARTARANPEDTCKGMFFGGLYQCVERERGAAGLEALQQLALARKFIAFFNYPIVEFLPLAWKAAELVAGSPTPESLEKGIRTLGRQATEDFLATAVGKTLLLLAGNDPRRLMTSLPTGYKTAVSYGQRTLRWLGPTHCVFSMRGDFMPHPYHEGVLAQVLSAVGAKNPQVRGQRTAVLDADYDVSWS